MMGIEWMKPGVFAGSALFALLGVAVFWICFVAMCIAIGLIVAAAIHG
jgi:hypothetical protein